MRLLKKAAANEKKGVVWGKPKVDTLHLPFSFSHLSFSQCSLLVHIEDKSPTEARDANPLLSMQLELRN